MKLLVPQKLSRLDHLQERHVNRNEGLSVFLVNVNSRQRELHWFCIVAGLAESLLSWKTNMQCLKKNNNCWVEKLCSMFYAVGHMQGFLCAVVEQSCLTCSGAVTIFILTLLFLTVWLDFTFVRVHCRWDGGRLMSPALFTLKAEVYFVFVR